MNTKQIIKINVLDICRYVGRPPELSRDLLECAWINYFGHLKKQTD